MTIQDKYACAELIQAWGLYRDQRRWPELLATFHPEGEIAVSWFRGQFREFVEHCKRGGPSKHLISPSLVRIAGERALAETNIVILVRQTIEGLAVDMTSRARFLERLERRQGQWRILERAAIYEQDRLDPVEPSDAFAGIFKSASAANYPEPYRYMALRLAAAGRPLAEPVHHDGSAPTRDLYARYEAWLAGG
jgi:SnoaL-like domain